MYNSQFFFQTRTTPGAIREGLISTALSASYERMMAAVAYATERGCKTLVSKMTSVGNWNEMQKDWLISFDLGLTEPSALEYLSTLSNSSIRIPNAEAVIRARLRPTTHFHSKIFLFEQQQQDGAVGLFSGSANLTFGGLFLNDEQGVSNVYIPSYSPSETRLFADFQTRRKILNQMWQDGVPLTQQLLDDYKVLWSLKHNVRKAILEDEAELVQQVDVETPVIDLKELAVLGRADCLWVDIKYVVPNLGKGKPGNQIDLSRGSRVFFGFSANDVDKNTVLGSVIIYYQGIRNECSMRFGDNLMDKLTLPLPGNPGPPNYANQTLLFCRRRDGAFTLRVGNATEASEWKTRSVSQGTLFKMKGGREYGTVG